MHFLLPMMLALAVGSTPPQMCAAHSDQTQRTAAAPRHMDTVSVIDAAKHALATPPPGLPQLASVRSLSLATYSYADARGIVKIDTRAGTVFAAVGFAGDGKSIVMKRVQPADLMRYFDFARMSAAYALQNDRFSEPAAPARCLAETGGVFGGA
jgi:hypothetical protein